jgi:hypothetical protein
MKKSVLCILSLSISLACLAVVRPPLINRFLSRYRSSSYRLSKRNYGNFKEEISAIEKNQRDIKTKIEQIKQRKAETRWSDVIPGFKNLRQQYADRKLQKEKLKLKKLDEAKEAGYRKWEMTLEQSAAKQLATRNKENWKK